MGLSNYQLVLLDNLIYLNTIAALEDLNIEDNNKSRLLKNVIDALLYKDSDPSNGAGSGTIAEDCINGRTGKAVGMMTKEEWVQVLQAIERDETLCNLQIYDVTDNEVTGLRAATFIGEDENIVIFRGTTLPSEWMDNAEGGYSVQSGNQEAALKYVDSLDIVNNNSFVVSGHSKGGNLAQFVALFSTDTIIDRCLSFDGQGFSEELLETEAYQQICPPAYLIGDNHGSKKCMQGAIRKANIPSQRIIENGDSYASCLRPMDGRRPLVNSSAGSYLKMRRNRFLATRKPPVSDSTPVCALVEALRSVESYIFSCDCCDWDTDFPNGSSIMYYIPW